MPRKDYVFECQHQKRPIQNYHCSLTEAECYTDEQKLNLVTFYVTKALIPTCKLGGTLGDLGWKGRQLGTLEKRFKEICHLDDRFLIARTQKCPKTIERFGLNCGTKICIECPRGVMTAECQVSEGLVRPRGNMTRMEVILAHIRNSIAHGNTYFFDNGNVLFVDKNRIKDTSCVLLIPAISLLEFMGCVLNEGLAEYGDE